MHVRILIQNHVDLQLHVHIPIRVHVHAKAHSFEDTCTCTCACTYTCTCTYTWAYINTYTYRDVIDLIVVFFLSCSCMHEVRNCTRHYTSERVLHELTNPDPNCGEAAEPCDRNFKQLADVYAKQGCIEAPR